MSCSSRPRSPGDHFIFGCGEMIVAAPAAFVAAAAAFLTATGKTMGGGVVSGVLAAPAHVVGADGIGLTAPLVFFPFVAGLIGRAWPSFGMDVVDGFLSMSFSLRKMWSKCIISAPVFESSRTI